MDISFNQLTGAFSHHGVSLQLGERSKPKAKAFPNFVRVTDTMRLKLIIMIDEYDQTCYKAAKLVGIPYANAKVIYSKYKRENRVIRGHREFINKNNNQLQLR